MFTDGSDRDIHAEIVAEDEAQHELRPGLLCYLLIRPWAVYVKEAQYFVDQGGLMGEEWAQNWEGPIAATSFADARRQGEEMRKVRHGG